MRSKPPPRLIFLVVSPFTRPPIDTVRCCWRYSTSSARLPSPHLPPPPSNHRWWQGNRNDEESSRSVMVRVWWDLENCQIPKGVDPYRVAHRITWALRTHGIRGPVNITAFGDMLQLNHRARDALCTTGICLYHVPNRGMNSADRSILADLVSWVAQNPPPAHFFLISGDRDFADMLHRLRMNNYNILIASSDGASGALCSAATIMWHWNGLVRGDALIGRHFNYPPDGSHSSWYGHYKGTLENPFCGAEEDVGTQMDECTKAKGESKIRSIPLALVSKISSILALHPEGVGPDDLLREIKRSNIVLDKDYFGYRKFSNLISSMTHIAKIKPHPTIEGQYVVYGTHDRTTQSDLPSDLMSFEGEVNPTDGDRFKIAETGGKSTPHSEVNPMTGDRFKSRETDGSLVLHSEASKKTSLAEQPPCPSVSNHFMEECTVNKDDNLSNGVRGAAVSGSESLLKSINITNITLKKCNANKSSNKVDTMVSNSKLEKDDAPKDGFFKRMWTTWRDGGTSAANNTVNSSSTPSKTATCQNFHQPTLQSFQGSKRNLSSGDFLNEVHSNSSNDSCSEHSKSTGKIFQLRGNGLDFMVAHASTKGGSDEDCSKKHGSKEVSNSGFFEKIIIWCKLWKIGSEDGRTTSAGKCKNSKPYEDFKLKSKPHDLFLKPHFWQSVEHFLQTQQGSELVSNSSSRTHLMEGLQKEGPSILLSLEECHLLHLVDLLISEKKWIHECTSQANPFKLVTPVKRTCNLTNARRQEGLSCLFESRTSLTNNAQSVQMLDKDMDLDARLINQGGEKNPPKNVEELKVWFQKVFEKNETVRAKDFSTSFEREFGKKLECLIYGYPSLDELLAMCLADCRRLQSKGRTMCTLLREEMISDCQELLAEVFKKHPEGILLSSLKPLFLERYGYPLDNKKLGHSKLVSVLKEIPGVSVHNETILPSSTLNVNFSSDKPANKKELDSSIGVEQVKIFENEDCSWDELGPPNDCKVEVQIVKIPEKELTFEEVSMSDNDGADTEHSKKCADVTKISGNTRKGEETLLLQILESWHNGKGAVERTKFQSANGLVDCSGNSKKKHRVPFFSSSNFKIKPIKSYDFVSNNDDENSNVKSDL